MSLQTRFAVLLATIGLAALLAVLAAYFTFQMILSEVREPVRNMSVVLSLLGEAKGHIEELGSIVNRQSARDRPDGTPLQKTLDMGVRPPIVGLRLASPTANDRSVSLRHFDEVERIMHLLREATNAEVISGKTTLDNLFRRLPRAKATTLDWLESERRLTGATDAPGSQGATELRTIAATELYELHNLIERVEKQVVSLTSDTVRYSSDLRRRLTLVLAFALLVGALTALLGLILLRRWVLRPIADLRIAAARIGEGDFDHRIIARSSNARDELTILSNEINHMASMVRSLQDERVERERLAVLGEMVRRLAHNLRNPLAGIRGLAENTKIDLGAARSPLDPKTHGELLENQDRIMRSVDKFEKWLADLLRATRPAQINPIQCQCRPWIKGVIETYLASAQTRGVEVRLEDARSPESAFVDPSHLEHALGAVISNAIEAAASRPDPRWVKVTSESVSNHRGSENPDWVIEISDSGPGIPPELRERIFAPYFTTKQEGSGIGLATAIQVIRAHGGRMSVENQPESPKSSENGSNSGASTQGAVFRLVIPTHAEVAKDHHVARIGQSGAAGGQDSDHR